MNELIKELYGNALDKAVPYTWHNLDHVEVEKIMKVFAELLIRECASICELNGQSYKFSFTPAKAQLAESTSSYCGIMIKKHFGVEE